MAEKLYFTPEEKKAANARRVREFQRRNYTINVVLPPETRERIQALNLGMSNTAFAKTTILNELSRLEKEKKKRDKEAGAE